MRRFARALALVALLGSPVSGLEPPLGQIVAVFPTAADVTQTYAIYLPKTFQPDRPWPILYVFDPMARGALAVRLFAPSAEKHGWIVVCSNNSRNGPMEPRRAALVAIRTDTLARFPIDSRRVYFAGMSGGTGPAWDMGKAFGAGVLLCGGPPRTKAAAYMGIRFAFYALAGDGDYNYGPMREMAVKALKQGGPARFEMFSGGHGWAPPEVLAHAIDWFELLAMRAGTAPRDDSFVRNLYAETLARARALETTNAHHAALLLRSMERDFAGLLPVEEVAESARRIEASKADKKAQKAEQSLLQRDLEEQMRLDALRREISMRESSVRSDGARAAAASTRSGEAGAAESSDEAGSTTTPVRSRDGREAESSARPDASGGSDWESFVWIDPRTRLLDELARHRKRMQKPERTPDVLLSQRVYERAEQGFMEAARSEFQQGFYSEAVVDLDVCVALWPESVELRIELVKALAASKKKKRALKILREAISLGYSDVEELRGDELLAPLRSERDFQAILQALTDGPKPAER